MSDPIEIELASGLNRVLYKKNNDIVKDIVVDPGTKLFIMKDNKYSPIGTLAEVRVASQKKVNEVWSTGPTETKIATVNLISGIIDTQLFAKPPTVGGKRKTRKYKRKNKRKTRKYKKR
jgi:hypothetical protein